MKNPTGNIRDGEWHVLLRAGTRQDKDLFSLLLLNSTVLETLVIALRQEKALEDNQIEKE